MKKIFEKVIQVGIKKQDGHGLADALGKPKVSNVLDKIVRAISEHDKITLDEFKDRANRYGDSVGMLPTERENTKNNSLRVVKKGNVSVAKFVEFIGSLLGYELYEWNVKFKRKDGSKSEITINLEV